MPAGHNGSGMTSGKAGTLADDAAEPMTMNRSLTVSVAINGFYRFGRACAMDGAEVEFN